MNSSGSILFESYSRSIPYKYNLCPLVNGEWRQVLWGWHNSIGHSVSVLSRVHRKEQRQEAFWKFLWVKMFSHPFFYIYRHRILISLPKTKQYWNFYKTQIIFFLVTIFFPSSLLHFHRRIFFFFLPKNGKFCNFRNFL